MRRGSNGLPVADLTQEGSGKMSKLYRVIVTGGTPQDRDRGQETTVEVLYCGYDRLEAIRVYHESHPLDFGGANYTGGTRWTVRQSKAVLDLDAGAMGSRSLT